MKIPANGFTHAGKFHADDVFATALLQILRPDIKITRGFTVPDDFDGIVYDIGFGMFDHHQEPRETRPNGIPYAAFGLLWQVLGPGLVGERQARLIDENFIQPLDLNDNTGEQNSLCDAIGFFNPVWDSKEDQDACFFKAVAVAKQILENQIESANAVNRADEKVQQRRDTADRLAREFKADGIIYEQMKYCDYWGFERALVSYIMHEEYNWPVLSIDRLYNNGNSGQLRTRVQAFVESLEIKRIQKNGGTK